MKCTIGAKARADIRSILKTSGDRFGSEAQRRYRLLIEQAIEDVAADPERAGVTRRGDLRLYHTRHARTRTPAGQRIGRPRHLLVFAVRGDSIEVLRLLHDAMDLPTRLAGL